MLLHFIYERLEEIICVVLLGALMILVFMGVIMRFVFSTAIAWQEELVGFLYVWLNYFGVVLGAKRGAHIRILSFITLLSETWQKRLLVLADILWVLFNGAVFYISIDLIKQMFRFKTVSPILDVNMAYAYYIIPICMVFTTIRIIQFNWRLRRTQKTAG